MREPRPAARITGRQSCMPTNSNKCAASRFLIKAQLNELCKSAKTAAGEDFISYAVPERELVLVLFGTVAAGGMGLAAAASFLSLHETSLAGRHSGQGWTVAERVSIWRALLAAVILSAVCSHVVLGFSCCGGLLLSYRSELDETATATYSLHWWLFLGRSPLQHVSLCMSNKS